MKTESRQPILSKIEEEEEDDAIFDRKTFWK